jgi:hypothetical protein
VGWVALAVGYHGISWLIVGTILLDIGVWGNQVINQATLFTLAPDQHSCLNTVYFATRFAGIAAGAIIGAALFTTSDWTSVGLCATALLLAAAHSPHTPVTHILSSRNRRTPTPRHNRQEFNHGLAHVDSAEKPWPAVIGRFRSGPNDGSGSGRRLTRPNEFGLAIGPPVGAESNLAEVPGHAFEGVLLQPLGEAVGAAVEPATFCTQEYRARVGVVRRAIGSATTSMRRSRERTPGVRPIGSPTSSNSLRSPRHVHEGGGHSPRGRGRVGLGAAADADAAFAAETVVLLK